MPRKLEGFYTRYRGFKIKDGTANDKNVNASPDWQSSAAILVNETVPEVVLLSCMSLLLLGHFSHIVLMTHYQFSQWGRGNPKTFGINASVSPECWESWLADGRLGWELPCAVVEWWPTTWLMHTNSTGFAVTFWGQVCNRVRSDLRPCSLAVHVCQPVPSHYWDLCQLSKAVSKALLGREQRPGLYPKQDRNMTHTE